MSNNSVNGYLCQEEKFGSRVIHRIGKIYYSMTMINKQKAIFAIFLIVSFTSSLSARGASPAESETLAEAVAVRLMVPSGATLGTVALMDMDSVAAGYEIETEVVKSTDLVAARLISGEADIAVIPSNLAAILYNKGADIRIAGPVIWGLLYVVTSEDLNGFQDLRGRTVNMIGRGLSPDIIFRHLLEENGLEPDVDVTITYASGATELAPAFLTGKSTVSMMPEPMITTVLARKPETAILVDIQDEWIARYGSSYPQAALVVSGAFVESHPEYVDLFINAFAEAVDAANSDPEAAGAAVADLAVEMNPEIFAAAISRMNLDFVSASESRTALDEYYKVLEAFNPATIGGTLPTDEFYLP